MAETVSPREVQATATTSALGQKGLGRSKRRQSSLWGDAWRRLLKNKLAIIGLVVVILLSLIALLAPLLAREPIDSQNYDALYARPSAAYPMGADHLGRDILSRVIWGARVSLLVGLVAQIIVLAIGVPIGAAAGFFGGKVDLILMRLVDVMYAFPTLLFVVLLMSMFGRGLDKIFLVIGLTSWVGLARLVRAQFLSLREKDFVIAARSIGATDMRLIMRHMLPNALTPIIVALTFGIPTAIFTEAFLSFIGVGIGPPQTSWGLMVGENQSYLRSYPWMLVWPSLALGLTMLSFTFLGDGLRDALDPNAKKD
ncbi:MAG TPA: ABC transporter permease [Thermomicrobiales bacterium]|jgi:ABC-type dipeptide/oligopeptide/nickel transport system permease subunit